MRWRAEIGRAVSVVRDEELLPPAPTRLSEVLLVGLLASPEDWLSRGYLAQRLYPDQDSFQARVALRQTVRRLRLWLGEGALTVTADYVRLGENWCVAARPAPNFLEALHHEWIEELRRTWMPALDVPLPHAEFADLVKATARADVDEARSILIGGRTMLWQLTADDALELLRLTHPANGHSDPLYTLLRAAHDHGTCRISSALSLSETALRTAMAEGQKRDARTIVGHALFSAAECGEQAAFSRWRSEAEAVGHDDVTIRHGLAALAWNNGDYDEALRLYKQNQKAVERADRHERLHYWSNFYVLAAQSGKLSHARQARERFLAEELGAKDQRWKGQLSFGDAWVHVNSKNPGAAIEALRAIEWRGWTMVDVDRLECLSLAYALMGDVEEARRAWRTARRRMLQAGLRPNRRRQQLGRRLSAMLP